MQRRTFLRSGLSAGIAVGFAGCSSNTNESDPDPTQTPNDTATTTQESTPTESEVTTEDEPDVDRPDSYRWDMKPGRNEELRSELGQYIEGAVGDVVQTHPAFEYSTDSEHDDHTVDFAALKLFRDTQYDILKRNGTNGIPWETYVESFVNDDNFEAAKTDNFIQHDTSAPTSYDSEAWLNAETVEDSLELAHSFLGSKVPQQQIGPAEQGTILREAYERHHTFDVLAWETNMGFQTGYDDRITGLMYSPDDDKIRAHDVSPPTQVGTGGTNAEASRKWHSEIQEWDIFDDGGELFHPLLFHTDEWNRQNPGFENAKAWAATTISRIASNVSDDLLIKAIEGEYDDRRGSIAPTTGLVNQLTRTTLTYNNNRSDFRDLWDYANLTQSLFIKEGNHIVDTAQEDDDYEGTFEGDLAIYEVDHKNIIDKVWADQAGQYDNFGQSYDQLA